MSQDLYSCFAYYNNMISSEIVKVLFRRNILTEEQMQAAIDRSIKHLHSIRPPEDSNAVSKYYAFLGDYSLKNPGVTAKEAHQACMAAHPEYWPRTLPQHQPVYSGTQ